MPVNATVAGTTRRLHKGNLRRKKEHAAPRPESRGQTRARTRRRAHEKHRAKAVRRTAGALKAGRSPGGAPAVMKDQAGAPARKKGSGTQRQSTRWEPEPEKKAVCPGQSATGCLPGSGANEGHAQSTAACRTPGKAPRGKAGDNVRQRNGSRQSDQQTEQGASFQKTLYPTAECIGQKKHLRKNPGKASATRIRGGDDSRLVNSDVRRKTLPATESPPRCPTTPHLRRTRGKQGYNEDSVHDEVVRKEPPSAERRRPSDDGATVSRQRRAYENIRPASGPSRGISSPFRNAAKVVIKISKSDTLSFKYVFVLFLQKAKPQVPQPHAPTPDFQEEAIFFPTVPNNPCRRRRDLAGTSRRTGSKRSNKLCGRFRHVPRVSKFAPRRAADADLGVHAEGQAQGRRLRAQRRLSR